MTPLLLALLVGCPDTVSEPHPVLPRAQGELTVETQGPHSALIRLDLDDPARATVACLSSEDDRHAVSFDTASTQHETVLHGLLASTLYRCRAAVSDDGEAAYLSTTATTAASLVPVEEWTSRQGTSDAFGFVLFNQDGTGDAADEQRILVVDRRGRLRWEHELPYEVTPDVDARYLGDGQFLYGGGYGGPPRIVDLSGTLLWQTDTTVAGDHHHHAELIDNTLLTLVVEKVKVDIGEVTGYAVQAQEHPSGDLLWSWHSGQGWADGWLAEAKESGDNWHANSLSWLDGDVATGQGTLLINMRNSCDLIAIDPADGSLQWTLGQRGDFTLIDEQGAVSDDWFCWQHQPEVVGDRILLYDNQSSASGRSRVLELELDTTAMTATVLWQYTENNWKEPIWGDADRLITGEVLVTVGHCETCGSADPDGRTQLFTVDPVTGEVGWRLRFADPALVAYRAQAIDGCALFRNTTACPDLPDGVDFTVPIAD